MTQSTLPAFEARRSLIAAVRAVTKYEGTSPTGKTQFLVEHVGAIAATILLRTPYSVQVGTNHVGDEPVAWFGRRHPSGRVEVVDLSPRHWWSRSLVDDHVWGWMDEHPGVFVPNELFTIALHAGRQPKFLDHCLRLALTAIDTLRERAA